VGLAEFRRSRRPIIVQDRRLSPLEARFVDLSCQEVVEIDEIRPNIRVDTFDAPMPMPIDPNQMA
jgi:hypothetical protein